MNNFPMVPVGRPVIIGRFDNLTLAGIVEGARAWRTAWESMEAPIYPAIAGEEPGDDVLLEETGKVIEYLLAWVMAARLEPFDLIETHPEMLKLLLQVGAWPDVDDKPFLDALSASRALSRSSA